MTKDKDTKETEPLKLTSPYEEGKDIHRAQTWIDEKDFLLLRNIKLKLGVFEPTLARLTHGLALACRHFDLTSYTQEQDFIKLLNTITFTYDDGKSKRTFSPYRPGDGNSLAVSNPETSIPTNGRGTEGEHPTLEDVEAIKPVPAKRVGKGRG